VEAENQKKEEKVSKREELWKKLKKGIPVDKVGQILDDVQREEALEKAPKKNVHRFENERIQRFSDLWFSQRTTAGAEQKNRVGLAYISKALGLGDDIAQKFAQGGATHEVGLAQSSIPRLDLLPFWQEVQKIFPDTYTDDDVEFLSSFSAEAVLHLIWQLDVIFAEDSPILRSLHINAHVYR
jgi:hypothetical protein